MLILILLLYFVGVFAGTITWMCDGYERTEKHFWNIIGLIVVWPLWLVIKIMKGIFGGLRDAIIS